MNMVNHESALENRFTKIEERFKLVKDGTYRGIEVEEVLKYAKDPFWIRLRIILLIICIFIWLGFLVSIIVVIVLTPKCPPIPKQEWWETSMVYCIQPKSFFDSDGDGIGDLKGIHLKLNYIKDTLKADAINLGIIQQSSGKSALDSDVVSFSELHEQLGSIQDFQNLCSTIHKKGMKLILDFVPNHSSDEHLWFLSSKNKTEPYTNFYIWHPGTKDELGKISPPNKLTNVNGEPAWTYDDTRKEFYYHTYSSHMPDLNLTNADVVARLDEAFIHWLRLKVDGFKILGGNYLVENNNVLDSSSEKNGDVTSLSDIIDLINHWRQLVNNQTEFRDHDSRIRVLLVDMDVVPANLSIFFDRKGSEESSLGPHLLINKQLLKLNLLCSANCLSDLIEGWFASNGNTWKHSNWMISDVSSSRIINRLNGSRLLNAINLLLLTMPGSFFLYYGEEIGMSDRRTHLNRMHEDSISFRPMQWNDQENAGFSPVEPWVSVADDYVNVNVETQKDPECGKLSAFSKLVSLRKEPSISWGNYSFSTSFNIFYYVRKAEGFPSILVAFNLGPTVSSVDLRQGKLADDISVAKATIVASTYNFQGERAKLFSNNAEVNLDIAILLHPGEGIVLKWLEN